MRGTVVVGWHRAQLVRSVLIPAEDRFFWSHEGDRWFFHLATFVAGRISARGIKCRLSVRHCQKKRE